MRARFKNIWLSYGCTFVLPARRIYLCLNSICVYDLFNYINLDTDRVNTLYLANYYFIYISK